MHSKIRTLPTQLGILILYHKKGGDPMATITFSEEEIQKLVTEIKNQLVPVLLQELEQKQLPHLLSREQFMEVAGIGGTKCNELFHRSDFYPVTREFGHPKVVTKLFFEWLHEKAGNQSEVNLKYPYKE